jgi:hypothetical protein
MMFRLVIYCRGERAKILTQQARKVEVTAEQIARVRERAEDTRRGLTPLGAVT